MAEHVRTQLLWQQASAARRRASDLWLAGEVMVGMGGHPDPVFIATFRQAASAAERAVDAWRESL